MERLARRRVEVVMKGAEKPKKVAKKPAQKSLKEKRADKHAKRDEQRPGFAR